MVDCAKINAAIYMLGIMNVIYSHESITQPVTASQTMLVFALLD
jgi:hypothetical protein